MFNASPDVERLWTVPVDYYGDLHVCVERLYKTEEFRRATNFVQKEKKAISADEVERLGDVDKADMKEKLLLQTFSQKLTQ